MRFSLGFLPNLRVSGLVPFLVIVMAANVLPNSTIHKFGDFDITKKSVVKFSFLKHLGTETFSKILYLKFIFTGATASSLDWWFY